MLGLSGTDDASRQALADASERYTAASSAIEQARTPSQAALAKESAIEGLYYVRAARLAMGMDPGPELPSTAGQSRAGAVSEERRINFEGREIEASPQPSGRTPNYYPGGTVAGRPVPAGWYSEPWWKPALVAGAWGVGSALLFNSLFSGMHGVGYGAQGFESGFGQGYSDGYDAGLNAGQDGGATRPAGIKARAPTKVEAGTRAAPAGTRALVGIVAAAAGTAAVGMAAAATSGRLRGFLGRPTAPSGARWA